MAPGGAIVRQHPAPLPPAMADGDAILLHAKASPSAIAGGKGGWVLSEDSTPGPLLSTEASVMTLKRTSRLPRVLARKHQLDVHSVAASCQEAMLAHHLLSRKCFAFTMHHIWHLDTTLHHAVSWCFAFCITDCAVGVVCQDPKSIFWLPIQQQFQKNKAAHTNLLFANILLVMLGDL